MTKVKTGIQGLDKALKGGIPQGNLVLVSGGAGTGKSTLAMQFLYNGAKLFGEKGLYISTEQTREELVKAANNFGWDVEDLEKKNLLQIKYLDFVKEGNPLQRIYDAFSNFEPKRMVIDSLTTLTDAILITDLKEESAFSLVQIAETVSPIPRTEQVIAKTLLYNLVSKLKLFKATVLLTSELYEGTDRLSADGISEFITDGVLVLRALAVGETFNRTLEVRKMRYTKIESVINSYEISSNGIISD